MINLDRDGDVFVLTMDMGENRWNTNFVRAFDAKLEEALASEGPAALASGPVHRRASCTVSKKALPDIL